MSQPIVRVVCRDHPRIRSALHLATATPSAALAATGPYVSLGDPYTAAPLVPYPTGNPILCGRSTNNYPSDIRRALAPSRFTDASCSSATTADMTQPQSLEGGVQTAPPQFDALRADDALVTLGIGGNDAGLIGVAEECSELDLFDPFGTRCKNHYDSGGSDPNVAAIDATGPKVACKAPGTAWVNGIVPTSVAFPLHPNRAGEQNMARQALAKL